MAAGTTDRRANIHPTFLRSALACQEMTRDTGHLGVSSREGKAGVLMREEERIPGQRSVANLAPIRESLLELPAMDIQMAGRALHRPVPTKEPLGSVRMSPCRVGHGDASPFSHRASYDMALGTGKFTMLSLQRKASVFVAVTYTAPPFGYMACRTPFGRRSTKLIPVKVRMAGFASPGIVPAKFPRAFCGDGLSCVTRSARNREMPAGECKVGALVLLSHKGGRRKPIHGVA